MDFENEDARLLFLRYALPCAETLVKRGAVSRKLIKESIENISLSKEINGHPEKIFKTANIMCEKIAKRLGKKTISKDVIRRYFLFEHDEVVDKRYKMFKDFETLLCRTYSGKVLSMAGKKATVRTIIGKRKYNMTLIENLKVRDNVVVHHNFVVEKINERLAKRLWKLKESYFKSSKV